MKIDLTKSFKKQYNRLSRTDKDRIDNALTKLESNPFDKSLKNHPIKGNMKGLRSISAGYDLRLTFEEFDDYVVVYFLSVGSHSKVYKK